MFLKFGLLIINSKNKALDREKMFSLCLKI